MGNQLIYSNAHNLHLQYHGFSLPHDLLTLPLLFFPEICFKKIIDTFTGHTSHSLAILEGGWWYFMSVKPPGNKANATENHYK